MHPNGAGGGAISRRAVMSAGMAAAAALSFPASVAARKKAAPWFDSMSFLPDDLADLGRAKMGAMICDVSQIQEVKDADGTPRYLRGFAVNDTAIDKAVERITASPDVFVALKGSDIGTRPGCAAFLQFQSSEMVQDDLSRIAHFHGKGLRVLQFTHHNTNKMAGGCIELVDTGLTALGREGLAEMNRLRILPDVSHGSNSTILDVARASTTPVALSHGACRAIVDHPRCATDEAIRAVADSGGAMGIFMMSFWLTRDPVPTIDHLLAQVRHVIRIGGIGAVGIANDFPVSGQPNLIKLGNDNREGVKEYLGWWTAMRDLGIAGFQTLPEHVVIPALNSIDRLSVIAAALDRDGYSTGQIEKIMGGNWQRTLRDVLG